MCATDYNIQRTRRNSCRNESTISIICHLIQPSRTWLADLLLNDEEPGGHMSRVMAWPIMDDDDA